MSLIFDSDFDVKEITRITGINPDDCKNRNETRINPFTKNHNPGYWTIKSKVFCEYDFKLVLDDLLNRFMKSLETIKELCKNNGGEIVFDIVPVFSSDKKPAIYFNKEFLKIVNFLDAEIQIDMYVCEDKSSDGPEDQSEDVSEQSWDVSMIDG